MAKPLCSIVVVKIIGFAENDLFRAICNHINNIWNDICHCCHWKCHYFQHGSPNDTTSCFHNDKNNDLFSFYQTDNIFHSSMTNEISSIPLTTWKKFLVASLAYSHTDLQYLQRQQRPNLVWGSTYSKSKPVKNSFAEKQQNNTVCFQQ